MLNRILVSCLIFFCAGVLALGEVSLPMAPVGARVYIIAPVDGQTVPQHFTVRFGLSGMGVAPAGIDRPNTGHHHLLIDVKVLPDLTQPLQATDNVRHFGGGQTETDLKLPSGKHTLQLIVANHEHIPHDKPIISKKITIFVE